MDTLDKKTPSMSDGLFVWMFGAALYLLAFFHRVAPAVITEELMRDFQISGASLGNLSAFYFYSYVGMQIPTGILVDRIGPRKLLTLGALGAAVGAVVFALASNISWAILGRLLIGGSVAVAFVGLLKIASDWFAPSRYAFISGLALCCGLIGAVSAGMPLRILVDAYGWRNTTLFSAVVAGVVGCCIWIFVRDLPSEKGFKNFTFTSSVETGKSKNSIFSDIVKIFSYRNTALLFFIPGGVVGCLLTFSGLWGVPYLKSLYGISSAEGAALSSALLVSWAFGGPFFGWLSDKLGNRKRIYLIGCGISLIGWVTIIFMQGIGLGLLTCVLLVTGFASGCIVLSFVFIKESVPEKLAGTASGVINMGVMAGPMILQPVVGWVLDRLWSGELSDGIRLFSPSSYQAGFSLMLLWLVGSFILLLFTRETHCRQATGVSA
jgi:MFS family permease